MSTRLQRIAAVFSITLLPGLLPAQTTPKIVLELRKENAALRQQVEQLRAQLEPPVAGDSKQLPTAEQKVDLWLQRMQARIDARAAKAAAEGIDLVLRPGTSVSYFRLSARGADAATDLGIAYRQSLVELTRAKNKLDGVKSPAEAPEIVDEIERALLDIRRAVRRIEQAAKRKVQDLIEKARKQPVSSAVRVMVPVLNVPVQLELAWPILGDVIDSRQQLFFSFRRF